MKVGLMGFGRAGRSVARVLLESKETNLQWIIRRSSVLLHRSVPEFLGVESDEPGLMYKKDEFTADELFDQHPVDVVVDFSSENGLDYYGATAARRGISRVDQNSQARRGQIWNCRPPPQKTGCDCTGSPWASLMRYSTSQFSAMR